MKDFVSAMKALSDENRVKIVKLLQYRDMCVCEIQALLKISQPSVSKHLKILEQAGLVDSQKDGLWVNYFINRGRSNTYAASLLWNIKHWFDDEPEMQAIIEMLPDVDRNSICSR